MIARPLLSQMRLTANRQEHIDESRQGERFGRGDPAAESVSGDTQKQSALSDGSESRGY